MRSDQPACRTRSASWVAATAGVALCVAALAGCSPAEQRPAAPAATASNFGSYATPERRLVFDLNDFDETLPGPFEWDVKRLCASLLVAARTLGPG